MHTIELKIEKPAYGGYGIGFYNGKVCFVPFAVPGDEAEVKIYKDKKDYCFGEIVRLTKEAIAKVKPECQNFGVCGGCSYLNISYDSELKLKKDIVIDSLYRISGIDISKLPDIRILSGERFRYRSHASVKSYGGKTGFFMRESNRIVPFPESGCCLLADPVVNYLSGIKDNNSADFKIACAYDSKVLAAVNGSGVIREIENNIIYDRAINLFFQSNRFLRSKMLDTVSEYASLSAEDDFFDIGCGSGFFTLYLASKSKRGYGIDINAESIEWARRNAVTNGISNVSFDAKSASNAVSSGTGCSVVILDPPRAGLEKKAREALNAMSPSRIVYVSCNPSTFARDTRDILNYGYSIERMTLIDMFPATHHIEVISLFNKKRI